MGGLSVFDIIELKSIRQTVETLVVGSISNNIITPWYIYDAIVYSGLLDEHRRLSHDCLYASSEFANIYTSRIYSGGYFDSNLYFSQFVIRYYNEEESNKILIRLTESKEVAENVLSFLDCVSEPLGDPNMPLPLEGQVIVTAYSFLRSVGIIDMDYEAFEKLCFFLSLYMQADGQTALCVKAKLYKQGTFGQFYEYDSFVRSYLQYGI